MLGTFKCHNTYCHQCTHCHLMTKLFHFSANNWATELYTNPRYVTYCQLILCLKINDGKRTESAQTFKGINLYPSANDQIDFRDQLERETARQTIWDHMGDVSWALTWKRSVHWRTWQIEKERVPEFWACNRKWSLTISFCRFWILLTMNQQILLSANVGDLAQISNTDKSAMFYKLKENVQRQTT